MFFGSSKVTYTKPAKLYEIDAPSGEWTRMNIEDIDAAYWNSRLKAGMAFGVDCSAAKMEIISAISNRLFIGIKNRKIIESKEVTLNERNAVTSTAKGILNNKSITIKAYSIIDDNCIYDFAYWTFKDDLEEEGIRDFEIFVKSLKWK